MMVSFAGGDILMMKEIHATKCQVKECNENAYFMLDTTFPDEPKYSEYPKYNISIPLCILHATLIQEGSSNQLRKIVSHD